MAFFRCMPPASSGGGGGEVEPDIILGSNNIYLPSVTTVNKTKINWSSEINEPVIISNKVASCESMFNGWSTFNSPVTFSNSWDNIVIPRRSYSNMFYGCAAFNQPIDVPNHKVPTDFSSMFYGCTALNANINLTDTEGVSSFENVFFDCITLNKRLNFGNICNSSGGLSARNMFYNCRAFNQPLYFNCNNLGLVTFDNAFINTREMYSPVLITATNVRILYMRKMLNNSKGISDLILNITTNNTSNNAHLFMIDFNDMLGGRLSSQQPNRINIYTPFIADMITNNNATHFINGYNLTWTTMTNGYYNISQNLYLYTNVSDGVNKFWDYYNNFYNIV